MGDDNAHHKNSCCLSVLQGPCSHHRGIVSKFIDTSTLEHPQLPMKQYHTQVVPNRPGLVIVKMNVSFPVCFGEEGVCQDPSRPIERQVVPMPVPGGKTVPAPQTKGHGPPASHGQRWEPLRGDSSSHSHPEFILLVWIDCPELSQWPQTKFCSRALRKHLSHTKH